MATPNYGFEKRQKELAKKRKKEDKLKAKADRKAWFLVLPVFLSVAFSAILPLMTLPSISFSSAARARGEIGDC